MSTNNLKTAPVYAHYLWHLAAIGLFDHCKDKDDKLIKVRDKDNNLKKHLSIDFGVQTSLVKEVWKNLGIEQDGICIKNDSCSKGKSTKVAIIDVGVAPHPAFSRRIRHSIDFGVYDGATVYQPLVGAKPDPQTDFLYTQTKRDELVKRLKLGGTGSGKLEKKLKEIIHTRRQYQPNFPQRLQNTAHGTAAAGLIAGFQPIYGKIVDKFCKDKQTGIEKVNVIDYTSQPPLPYFGVDPSAIIIPITTSHGADPRQLIRAFMYALDKADVICFPRDIADPRKTIRRYPKKSTCDSDWELLEKVIISVAKLKPLICAAGNSGESKSIYPASLASSSEVISVGAVSYEGYRAGYSNYGQETKKDKKKDALTVVAPSGDSEVINRHQIRIDKDDIENKRQNWDDYYNELKKRDNLTASEIKKYPFSPQNILTTDVPGRWGYTGSQEDDDGEEIFNDWELVEYSGTSAAAAIVAGVASLYIRKQNILQKKLKISGKDFKKWLEGSGAIAAHGRNNGPFVGSGKRSLTRDISNKSDKYGNGNTKRYSRWFGHGLVSVKRLF